jgi:7,8-dihydropterin-6-yl-methyl-4-(beta-D-ribofuranosyl)aminobenzene 5'-phosphate synthase
MPDPVPEDSALVFDTERGLVVLTGCGHAGLINTLEQARAVTGRPDAPIYAVAGCFHLHRASDGSLDWTAENLRALGVRHLHGGHCTGLETVYRVRRLLGLPREAVSVAAVGSWFDLADGIHPLSLAR